MADSSGIDPSVDPIPTSNLQTKSLADLARLAEHLPVDWTALPRVPFYGPWLGYNAQWYRAAVALSVLETRWRGQRTLTPEEVQIVAGQTGKAVVTLAHEVPLLVGTTLIYERRGRATFRFPFYQPQPSATGFNPDVFPAYRAPWLRGTAARSAWHAVRATLYGCVAHWAWRTLLLSYSMAVKSAEFESDPRLADLRASIRQAAAARMSARRLPGGQPASQHAPRTQLPPPPQDQQDRQDQQDQQYQQDQQDQRDTSGEYGDASGASADLAYYNRQQRGDGDLADQPQQQQQQQPPPQQQPASLFSRYRRPSPASAPLPAAPAPAAPPPPRRDDGYDADGLDDGYDDAGFHDDASPLSPSAQAEKRRGWASASASAAGGGGSSGSAWDRVRAGAATSTAAQPGSSPASSSQQGWAARRRGPPAKAAPVASDDYTFNEGDEEKTYARSQAQKEFDEMLERERKGESDSERRRW